MNNTLLYSTPFTCCTSAKGQKLTPEEEQIIIECIAQPSAAVKQREHLLPSTAVKQILTPEEEQTIIECIAQPSNVPECVHKLAATVFVQEIRSPVLSSLAFRVQKYKYWRKMALLGPCCYRAAPPMCVCVCVYIY